VRAAPQCDSGHVAPRTVARPTAHDIPRTLPWLACAGMLAGSTCLVLGGAGAANPRDPRDLWFWGDMPLGTTHAGYALPRLLGFGGLLLLFLGWLALGLAARRGVAGPRAVLLAAAVTSLPLLVAPPLTSADA